MQKKCKKKRLNLGRNFRQPKKNLEIKIGEIDTT